MKRLNFIVYIILGIVGATQLLLVHQDVAIFATQSSPGAASSSSHSNPGSDSISSGSSSSSSSNNDGPLSSGQSSSGGPSGSGAEESSPAELGGVSQNNNTNNQTFAANAENTTSTNSS